MKNVHLFNVAPAMPEPLVFLETLAHNLWWSWNLQAVDLFRRINPDLWRESGHNPLEFLCRVPQARLESLASNDGFRSQLKAVREQFEKDVTHASDAERDAASPTVAYFSLEYGIHESIRMYSGGLGVLSGDHLKAASDLALPLAAVGLFYRQGYFQQYLDRDGWQQEFYPENEIHCMPFSEAVDSENRQIQVTIPLPEGNLTAVVWRLNVGRVPLFLLDSNVQENPPEFRAVTAKLYDGDRKKRIRQELLLGIGGVQALTKLGIEPAVFHMNEGHAAFLSLARIATLMKRLGVAAEAAAEIAFRSGVFTTHTPVPAGNESFDVELLKSHVQALEPTLGLPPKQVAALGQPPNATDNRELSMTVLGLRTAQFGNGVSRLHGEVARKMWQHLWPERPPDEIPIRHVTNGVHIASWLSVDMASLFNRYLGDGWRRHPSEKRLLTNVGAIPDEELWRAHELSRSHLIRRARELLERQLRNRNAPRAEIAQAKSVLDHDALTNGLARRLATYKRGTLLLHDPDRFEALLTNEDRPIQIVFAGKAHPADDTGKELIKQLHHFARRPGVRRRMVFLENYDIEIARFMVQGVDVWLNTPRRPLEASGTSGMKAAVNGAINVGTLDGWWDEAYQPEVGWAIGAGEEYNDWNYQDTVEAQALYNLLENDIVPCFYERETADIPTRWLAMVKASIRMTLNFFTSHRMVEEYDAQFYSAAESEFRRLTADNGAAALRIVEQRKRLQALWPNVSCRMPTTDRDISNVHVGDAFVVETIVSLGELRPEEVDVEVYYGPVNSRNEIFESHHEYMHIVEKRDDGSSVYRCELTCRKTGRYGFTVRITPSGEEWKAAVPGFLKWAG